MHDPNNETTNQRWRQDALALGKIHPEQLVEVAEKWRLSSLRYMARAKDRADVALTKLWEMIEADAESLPRGFLQDGLKELAFHIRAEDPEAAVAACTKVLELLEAEPPHAAVDAETVAKFYGARGIVRTMMALLSADLSPPSVVLPEPESYPARALLAVAWEAWCSEIAELCEGAGEPNKWPQWIVAIAKIVDDSIPFDWQNEPSTAMTSLAHISDMGQVVAAVDHELRLYVESLDMLKREIDSGDSEAELPSHRFHFKLGRACANTDRFRLMLHSALQHALVLGPKTEAD